MKNCEFSGVFDEGNVACLRILGCSLIGQEFFYMGHQLDLMLFLSVFLLIE